MVSAADMQQLLFALQAENSRVLVSIAETQTNLIKQMMTETRTPNFHNNLIDTRGIGKPSQFRGEDVKFHEWMSKLVACLKVTNEAAPLWPEWAAKQGDIITDADLELTFKDKDVEGAKRFSNSLHALLINITEDEAFLITNSVKDCCGLESFRLLRRRYAPCTAGTKRSLLKSIINNVPAKKVSEVEANLMHVETLLRKYEAMTDEKNRLPEDLKTTVIIELCHKDLREHLELSTDQMSYSKVRTEIPNYVERKRDAFGSQLKAMEVDAVNAATWSCPPCTPAQGYWSPPMMESERERLEEINIFTSKGKGGGKGNFGEGAKGFQGMCYWCGEYGHSQSKCRHKDEYMNALRQGKGAEKG